MLSKSKIAYIKSLQNRKNRHELGRFVVEGKKSILETIDSDFRIVEGFFVENFLHPLKQTFPVELVSEKDLQKISSLASNKDGIIVVEIPKIFPKKISKNEFTLVLDGMNDPWNLGTIVRIADWYGISQIIASPDTVDIFNPKTIMASMGSFTRVKIFYENLEKFFTENPEIPVFGAFLDGENIHKMPKNPEKWCIVIGSEANGIRENIQKFITHKITIPRFGAAESLNAWVATGIIVDRFLGE